MTNDEFLQEAQELIQNVVEADTNNFLEIAKIAGIDIKTELAGANLSGFNLRGADLCEADLRETNLNGANLSGANLRGANLSGANLRGANLSGANLSGANLIEAILIEAILSGANFSGANLIEAIVTKTNKFIKTNFRRVYLIRYIFSLSVETINEIFLPILSDTNHSGAKVNNAQFGGSIGISEDMKRDLIRRGAIF
ncbi:MAG: pentapeptide repeat-containing protein [Symploca sp. SIO3E6]|nr:pentapeptide repeat-containing protein [Caldora sp. SIO3E6]